MNEVLTERVSHLTQKVEDEAKKSSGSRELIFNKLEEIHTQTKLTNGRVNRLEAWSEDHKEKHDNMDGRERDMIYKNGKRSVITGLFMLVIGGVIGGIVKLYFE